MRRILSLAVLIIGVAAVAMPQPARGGGPPGGIVISGPDRAPNIMTPARLAALPAISETVSFGTDHGQLSASFSGPLLWAVLQAADALDVKMPKRVVREYAVVTGADGYQAVLALGEIAPAFEDKTVILATMMNGKSLQPGHFRLVVPGERRGGRSVRDVVAIAVLAAAPVGNPAPGH